jgi:hypothetical protein
MINAKNYSSNWIGVLLNDRWISVDSNINKLVHTTHSKILKKITSCDRMIQDDTVCGRDNKTENSTVEK